MSGEKPVEERIAEKRLAEHAYNVVLTPAEALEVETELRKLRAQLAEAVEVAEQGARLASHTFLDGEHDEECLRCKMDARLSALAKESGVG